METKKRMARKLDLLTAVEQIVELSKESHLDAEFFKKAARPIKYLAERLELTKEQCVMMAHCDSERLEQKDNRKIGFA